MKAAFLITIDVEGDDLWSAPTRITTENARCLPRFHALCEDCGVIPTYLTDYDMARSTEFAPFAAEVLRRGTAEVGAHMHAWNTPPIRHLTECDYDCGPYAFEYRPELVREKVGVLTSLLEDRFEAKMTSHRAGRWGFDGNYARVLIDRGYLVDCSVTPGVSWESSPGLPNGAGGPDYTGCPHQAYFVDLEDVRRAGNSPLLEVPVTISPTSPRWVDRIRDGLPRRNPLRRALNRLFPPLTWLRPNGRNLGAMLRLLERAQPEGRSYAEFMLHSSELMPGANPNFRTEGEVEKLYRDLRALFSYAGASLRPLTLSGFAREFTS